MWRWKTVPGSVGPVVLCDPCDREFAGRTLCPKLKDLWGGHAQLCSPGAHDGDTVYARAARAVEGGAQCYVVLSSAAMGALIERQQGHTNLPASYRALGICAVRAALEPNSDVVGQLDAGQTIYATESVMDSGGVLRLKCEDGWVGLSDHALERVEELPATRRRRPPRARPRRHSVAKDGVGEVTSMAGDVATSLGAVEERVFTVGQTHIPKAQNLVQLKVGGMGLAIFDGPTLLETHMYPTIDAWEVGKQTRFLSIRKSDKGKREIRFQVIGDEGAEIAQLMKDHATSVARKIVDNRASTASVPSNAEPETASTDEASTDDGDDAETEQVEWWKEEIRLPQDRLNLIDHPALHRFFATQTDRTVHFSGTVVEVIGKDIQREYTLVVSKRAIYRMVHPCPEPEAASSATWECKGRLRINRLKMVTCSERAEDQISLTFHRSGGATRSRKFQVDEGRRNQLLSVLQALHQKVCGSELEVTRTAATLFANPSPKSITGSVFTKDTYIDRKVTETHDAAELTYMVLMGCALSVATNNTGTDPLSARAFYSEDYVCEEKRAFPSTGSRETAPHRHRSFTFTSYAPRIFQRIREIGGVSEASYLQSLTALSEEQIAGLDSATLARDGIPKAATLCEMSSNSKSGAFFFFTTDMCFIVKTVGIDEKRVLVDMLSDYLAHYERNPDSLINKICGCYSSDLSKEPFIVMKCTFPLSKGIAIHEVYDLKGSMHGRQIKEKEKQDKVVIYKDNDFDENPQRAFKLDSEKRKWFLARLKADVAFLRSHSLLDYSLLVGIHFRDKASDLSFDGTNAVFSRDGENEVYYIEIIDYLIQYNTRKKLEKKLRGSIVNMSSKKNRELEFSSLSVCEPPEYSERMLHFITSKCPHPGMMTQRRRSSTFFSADFAAPTSPAGRRNADMASTGKSGKARARSSSGIVEPGVTLPGLDAAAMQALQGLGSDRERSDRDEDGALGAIEEGNSGKEQDSALGAIEEGPDEAEDAAVSVRDTETGAGSDLLGHYRVLRSCVVRAGPELESTQVGDLSAGQLIDVTGSAILPSGTTRIHCSSGWLSLLPHLVESVNAKPTRKGTLPAHAPSRGPASSASSVRRHSVALEGIKGVGSLGREMSRSLGAAEERVFQVTQSHIRKAPSKVDLRIGGMGIALFSKSSLLESYLYQAFASWAAENQGRTLVISKRDGGKFSCETRKGEAAQMCRLMEEHASFVHKVSLASPPVQRIQPAPSQSVLGEYRVKKQTIVREGPETESTKSGELSAGDVINVIDAIVNSKGVTRLRCADGWVSLKSHLVQQIDANLDSPSVMEMHSPRSRTTGRRHSVAVEGVKGVASLGERLAQSLGVAQEKVFNIVQEHIKRAPGQVQLKVGGMGISLFDGPKVLESILYSRMDSWNASREDICLDLRGAASVRLRTPDANEIALLMKSHAESVAAMMQAPNTGPRSPHSRARDDASTLRCEDASDVATLVGPEDKMGIMPSENSSVSSATAIIDSPLTSRQPGSGNAMIQLYNKVVDRLQHDGNSVTLIWLAEYITIPDHGALMKRFARTNPYAGGQAKQLGPVSSVSGRTAEATMAVLLDANGIHVDPRDNLSVAACAQHVFTSRRYNARVQHQRMKMDAVLACPSLPEGVPARKVRGDCIVSAGSADSPRTTPSISTAETAEARVQVLRTEMAEQEARHSSELDSALAAASAAASAAQARLQDERQHHAATIAQIRAAQDTGLSRATSNDCKQMELSISAAEARVQVLRTEMAEQEARHSSELDSALAAASAAQARLQDERQQHAVATAQIRAGLDTGSSRVVTSGHGPVQAWEEERAALLTANRLLEDQQRAVATEMSQQSQRQVELEEEHHIAAAAWAAEHVRLQTEMKDRVEAVVSMAAAASVDSDGIDEMVKLQRRVRELECKRGPDVESPSSATASVAARSDGAAAPHLQTECERLEALSKGLASELNNHRTRLDQQRSDHAELMSTHGRVQSELQRKTRDQVATNRELRELRAQYDELVTMTQSRSQLQSLSQSLVPQRMGATTALALTHHDKRRVPSGGAGVDQGGDAFDTVRNRAHAVQQQVEELEQEMRELVIASPFIPSALAPMSDDPDLNDNSLSPETRSPSLSQEAVGFDLHEFCRANELIQFENGLRQISGENLASLRNTSLAELNRLGLNTVEKLRFRRACRIGTRVES